MNLSEHDFEKLLGSTDIQYLLQYKNVMGCPKCPKSAPQSGATGTAGSESTSISENDEKEKKKEFTHHPTDIDEDEPNEDTDEIIEDWNLEKQYFQEEGKDKRGTKKQVCSLEINYHLSRLWNDQKSKCACCEEPLTLYKRLHAASNFRFRLENPQWCPTTDNIKFLLCVPCCNLLRTTMYQEREWKRVRSILFTENRSRSVFHLAKLPEYVALNKATSNESFLPGSQIRITGLTRVQLRSLWENQAGLSAFRITPEILEEMDEETQQSIHKEIQLFEKRKATLKKRKLDIGSGSSGSSGSSEKKLGTFLKDPNYLVFQVPLSVYSSPMFGFKLFPRRTRGNSADENSTLVCNLFFGMMGNLTKGEFLSWARRRIKRAPLPILQTKKGLKVSRYRLPPSLNSLQQQAKEKQNVQDEKKMAELAQLEVEKKRLEKELRQQKKRIKVLGDDIQEPLLAQLEETQKSEKDFENLGVSLTFGMRAGRPRPVDRAFLDEKLPELVQESFPSPCDRKLSASEYEDRCKQIIQLLWSKEFRVAGPPTWKIGIKNLRKKKVSG